MSKIVIVSNRLPITIDKKAGELVYYPSAGGLATGLTSLDHEMDKVWIGWPGEAIRAEKEKKEITKHFAKDDMIPVFLTKKDIELYYEGFSNKTIWPLFHYFTQYTTYSEEYWNAYKSVNNKFAEVVCQYIKEDYLIWVQDYQLMLLPALIRKKFPNISIGFFLHIPFPSYEIFRILPWREELLEGLLGSDQIGFHTFDYMRHFLSAVYRITGHEHSFGQLAVDNRIVNVDVFPMGIDYEKFARDNKRKANKKDKADLPKIPKDKKLILSIDRLDYTKGIPQRIQAYEKFLVKNENYHGVVTLILIVVPSRSNVDQYRDLKKRIDTLVGRINGQYGTFEWEPIQYFYRSFPFEQLRALYNLADIALITPLRDGMNLVAKEFVVSKQNKSGVLILSEMAGAANELTEAIIINPQDEKDMVKALEEAMTMPSKEQDRRLEEMQERLKKYTVQHWAKSFILEQIEATKVQGKRMTKLLTEESKQILIRKYKNAKRRLLLLDYDGTLMDFQLDPQAVVPDKELLSILSKLNKDKKNKLVLISGRDHRTLEEWFKKYKLDMSAEHGVWIKKNGKWTITNGISFDWKKKVKPVLENLVRRTPGSFIEEKDYSVVWHYRKIDKELGQKRIREFRDVLLYLTANLDLQVLEGNKVVEIKNAGVNKGKASLNWLDQEHWDFIMAIGDDHTDEDTFKAMPKIAYTIKVGLNQTTADYNLLGVNDVRNLLKDLTQH